MEQFMELLDFNVDSKRKMGRPPKVPPFSHYDAYKRADIDFFISLFSGREELYNPCEEFNEFRQKALHFIEKKCCHFLAMRKGRNAEKLWLYLFNDFEKVLRNGGDKKDDRCKSIMVYFDCLKFLIPYLQKADRMNLPRMSSTFNLLAESLKEEAKRPKLEHTGDQMNADDWLQKVIETVTNQPSSSGTGINLSSVLPVDTKTTAFPFATYDFEQDESKPVMSLTSSEKHADIISCVTNFLEEVPKEKLMLCKVRLFQFIEEEKKKLKEEKSAAN
ncbi:unnamed protein product [Caenorhabditis sp. 36 PRJEB53466]|nr:unnamed protein product [Caenorhabditis sp. 36 PRJEB53466]